MQMDGWKKVYWYYGIIFFGLGLLGFLFNNRVSLPQLAQLTLTHVSRELTDLGLIPPGVSREATVSHPGATQILFVTPYHSMDSQSEGLKEQIYNWLAEKTHLVRYPVAGPEWYKSPQTEELLIEGRFLIGMEPIVNGKGFVVPGILFSVSDFMAAEFFKGLINQRPDFPLFKLELIAKGENHLYRLSFGEPGFSSGHLITVLDSLLKLWKTAGSNQQRRNYRETIW